MEQLAGTRPRPGYPTPAVYWRRRVCVLAAGLGVLSLTVWGLNAAVTPSGRQGALAGTSAGGRGGGTGGGVHSGGSQAGPGSPDGSGGAVTAGPTPTASGPGDGHARATAAAGPSAGPARHGPSRPPRPAAGDGSAHSAVASPSPGPQRHEGGPAQCTAGEVSLSLSSPRYWYVKGQWPEFVVKVADTGASACRENVGTKFVSVSVANGSQRRVWSSADCAKAPTSRVVVLKRGAPVTLRLWWDRKAASPGCHVATGQVRLGSFTAVAVSGSTHSKVRIFVLGAAGMAVP